MGRLIDIIDTSGEENTIDGILEIEQTMVDFFKDSTIPANLYNLATIFYIRELNLKREIEALKKLYNHEQ